MSNVNIFRGVKLNPAMLALAVGLALAMPLQAFAQEQAAVDGEQRVTAADNAKAVRLDSVTVTAQHREERAQDVPITITALSAESLREAGVNNVSDLANVVSGMVVGGVGNSTQPAIRGVSTTITTGGAENSTSLYVDGVFYRQAQLLNTSLPDVERIEVLKGPQGTLFGRNSVGGAIRIFTRNPSFERYGDATVELGYYTGNGGSHVAPHSVFKGFFTAPLIDDKLAFSVSAAYDGTDGWLTDETNGKRTGAVKRENARAKLLFQPTENVSLLLNAYYLNHDDRGYQLMTPLNGLSAASGYAGTVVPTKPWHVAFDIGPDPFKDGVLPWDATDAKSHGVSLLATWKTALGTFSSITATIDDRVFNRSTVHQARGTPACWATAACLPLWRDMTNDTFTQELNFASEQFGRFRYTGGLYYYDSSNWSYTNIMGTIVPGGVPYINIYQDIKSKAAFGEVEFAATDRLMFILGGRYTKEDRNDSQEIPVKVGLTRTFSSFLPRVSARYALTESANIYATYSKGSASGLTGIANQTSGFSQVLPEENTAIEVGYKWAKSNASIDIAVFDYDYTNKQEQVWLTSGLTQQNTGPVKIRGVDFSSSYRFENDLILRANLSWLPTAEYTDFRGAVTNSTERNPNGTFQTVIFDATGQRLVRAPKLTGNFGVARRWSGGTGKFDASANLSFSTELFHELSQTMKQRPYQLLSAQFGYTWYSGFRLGLYGNNLTNEAYFQHAWSSGSGFNGNYGRPREIGLNARYSF